MFNIGMPELVVIFVVALIFLGPKRLPEVARQLGKAVAQLKKASMDLREAIEKEPPEEIKQEVREKLGYTEQPGQDKEPA
ncbi:MAG: Sec-independent protein translocase protein TatB [Deltaproteobacteria bacterium]